MPKWTSVLLIAALMLIATACDETVNVTEDLDLEAYINTVELPPNLSITFDPSEVELKSTARIYNANYLEFNTETLKDILLQNEIAEQEQMAEGPWHKTEEKDGFFEILMVYDGGRGLGIDLRSSDGGFIFIKSKTENDNRPNYIPTGVGPPSLTEQRHLIFTRSGYSSYVDLPFMSYGKALDSTTELLATVGYPEIELTEAYTLDLDSIREQYKRVLEETDGTETAQWTEEDEQFLFHFRQMIDGIPVINLNWSWGRGTNIGPAGNTMPATLLSLTYSQDGVTFVQGQRFYDHKTATSGEEETLIGAAQALQTLIDEYSGLILEEETQIASAELVYVSTPDNDLNKLTPAWVFDIARSTTSIIHETGDEFIHNNYTHYVVHAVTGDKMSGSR